LYHSIFLYSLFKDTPSHKDKKFSALQMPPYLLPHHTKQSHLDNLVNTEPTSLNDATIRSVIFMWLV